MSPSPRLPRLLAVVLVILLGAFGAVVGTASPASAASPGAGFGTWAPLSAHGWHGSMVVGGVHTYCILPGLPAPTGTSIDHGITGEAGGLSPQQLVAINYLVTTYGQTGDAVQAAAVGWAVKAIADRATTVQAWGHPGDSLAGAVTWIFSRFAPDHAAAVAERAEAFYAEALTVPVPGTDATLQLTTDAGDPRRGVVRIAGGAATIAEITLENAVFADSGTAQLTGAVPGVDYPIVAAAPTTDGLPYSVRARARVSAPIAPAVQYVTTDGQQSTAGPGGGVAYDIEAADTAPRPVVFSPGIATQVGVPETTTGPFVDDVTVSPVAGVWPRGADGAFVALRASATVYRTTAPPTGPDIPADAVAVGELALVTDPAQGGGTYRVTSEWMLPGPGYYTAVWSLTAAAQDPAVAVHLERDYRWAEEFATPSQIVHVPAPPAPPAPESPRALAATGPASDAAPRVGAAGLAALVAGAALLAHLAQRRRPRRA